MTRETPSGLLAMKMKKTKLLAAALLQLLELLGAAISGLQLGELRGFQKLPHSFIRAYPSTFFSVPPQERRMM